MPAGPLADSGRVQKVSGATLGTDFPAGHSEGIQDYKAKKREEFRHLAVYPCKLCILPQHIFNTRDPISTSISHAASI